MTTQSAIDLLEPATAFRLAGKYARQAQQYLTHGDLQQAYIAWLDGHFVAGHDGDDSLGLVRVWLEDLIVPTNPHETQIMRRKKYVNGLTVTSNRQCNDGWLVIGEDTQGVEYFCTFPPDAKPTWKDILEAQERNDFQLL